MNETFTSQSGNFVSALKSQVDPRTGQFMVNLPLAKLVGNHQLGPELSLGLSYSPLYTKNNGFGIGFSLGVTQFNNRTNHLELSNGETYRVAAGTDQIFNKKLDSFRFSYTNGNDDADGYTVYWKEGKQEKLTLIGENRFVTSEVISPLGRKLKLSWNWNGQTPLLTEVTDKQATLCSVTYEDVVTMTLWPGTQDEFQFMFRFINGDQLSRVSRNISKTETMEWSFDYVFLNEAQDPFLCGVHYPTGKTETVEYNTTQGHKFPESSGVVYQLPAVLSSTSNPGGGQPHTTTYFEYTPQNFLGYSGNFGDWSKDSDYIYTYLTDYAYSSTETVSEGETTVTTIRTYNNYHLQTSEKTLCGGNVHQVDYTYYAQEGQFIESQPKQFQLMREKKETWTDENGISRAQSTHTEFDESGNPVKEVSPDGTETISSWYAAEGEEGCPAEANGFIRFMKTQTVRPCKTDYDAPIMITKYKYMVLGEDKNHVVQDAASEYADDVLIHRRNFLCNGNSIGEFGRIIAITDTKYEKGETSASYASRQEFETVVKDGVMNQKITFTGHDGIRVTSMRIQSAHSGLLLSETDAQGVTTTHSYDVLGRPLKRHVAPGTLYEDITTWSYSIEETGPVTIETDHSGNQSKVVFDGAGRKLNSQQFDEDGTKQWYEVYSQTYNSFGDVTKITNSDWHPDNKGRYSSNTMFSRDNWGTLSTESYSNGTKKLNITNPIAMTRAVHMEGDIDGKNLRGGTFITTFDQRSSLPNIETRLDLSGAEKGRQIFKWDGIGRLREERNELNHVIKRSYDVHGRVLTQTLPDGSVVTRTYAPHLIGEQVSSISVTGPNAEGQVQTWILGTQEFDSLARITERVCGGRKTSYQYDGTSSVPSAIILPSGEKIVYTYIPELGNAVSSVTAQGIKRAFSYDMKTGQLLSAEENNAKLEKTWSKLGLLTGESFSQNGKTQKSVTTYTFSGIPVTYTDINGKKTQYFRDGIGRVSRIIDDALIVDMKYDPLERLSERTVRDPASSSSLTTSFSYDEFGHETERATKDNLGMTLSLSQTWEKNSLLATRITKKNGISIREENYKYDSRSRLIYYNVSGTNLPVDSYGDSMKRQTYCFDALNNLTSVKTTLSDNEEDTALYFYNNNNDPTQLTTVTHTHKSYPEKISLSYDAEGRMTCDEEGRTLSYDVMGRLSEIRNINGQSGSYRYDAQNRIITCNANESDTRNLYYRDNELVNEIHSSQKMGARLIKMGHTSFGVRDDSGLTLTTADSNDSLLWSVDTEKKGEGQLHTWSPYGSGISDSRLPGFNGERIDPVSHTYHLGNGYRAYNPVLMRFNCPDSLSPFGAGGINAYAYCAGDPVNQMDPSGHLSWHAILGIVMGVVGVSLAVFTAGSSIIAAGSVMAAVSSASATSLIVGGLGIASDITAIASGALEESNPEVSSILGWVSLATGLAGLAAGVRTLTKAKGLQNSQNLIRARIHNRRYNNRYNPFFNMPHRFPGVDEARVVIEPERMPYWHPIAVESKGHTYLKFGTDTPIIGSDVRDPLELLSHLKDGKRIIILSGTHGDRSGANWVTRIHLPRRIDSALMRRQSLREIDFFVDDVIDFANFDVEVLNMYRLPFSEFQKYIMGDYHVILAFCYGRNDMAYRSLLGLKPVISYAKSALREY